MQGQRGVIGSLPETLEFDHGSTAGNAIMDQQMCWNNMRNPAENRLGDFMLSPSHMNNTYMNSIDQERQNLSGWSLGEPSSSNAQNEVSRDEQKTEHGWASSATTYSGAGPRLEERRYESRNILSLDNISVNPQSVQSSNSSAITPNLNLNAGFVGIGTDNCQVMEGPSMYKSSGAGNDRIPSASGSNAFLLPSGSGGYLMEDNDSRPGCSLDGRRQSCKRKAVEGNIGQSSMSGSSSFFQRSENSAWPNVPTHYDNGSSLSISAPSEQANASLALGVRGLASESMPDSVAAVNGESSRRNFRLRMNPSNQEPAPPSLFSTGGVVRRSGVPSSHQSSRPLPADHSLDFRSSPAAEGTSTQSQPVVIPVPALPQNGQPFRWNENSSSRVGSSSAPINLGDREEASSRSIPIPRNLWQHPMIVPATDLRTLVRNPTIRSASGIPGTVASTSRTGSSSSVHPIPAPTLIPPPNPPSRYSRGMAEFVRQSLLSANAAESGGPNSIPVHPGPPASSEEAVLPSGPVNRGRHRPFPRLSSWMERHGDGVLGIPYPLRNLTASTDGSRRLAVSEIRNVLDLMRRGESLRFEDVMILDQSVFFGMADVHDRHRDMRLDVDNMSYEELLALEERIGNVSTGLSEETIIDRIKRRKYLTAVGAEAEVEPCCICQEEYNDGEDLGTLDCGHDFHSDCIKEWLKHKNLCPICKTTGLAT